jgi:hypothetical protein
MTDLSLTGSWDHPGPPKNRRREASGVTAWYVYEMDTASESGLLVLLFRVHESQP